MIRIPVLILLLPFRLFVFCYMRIRSWHKKLLLEIHIRSDYTEAPLSHGIWSYFKPAKDRFYLIALEMHSILTAVRHARLKVARLRITFEAHSLGWAQAWELRDLISQLGKLGVETHAYLLSDDKISLFIASACSRISCPESTTFDLSPFTSESLFVQSLLTKLGIRPQFVSVGEFKSAAEIFTRTGMSPAARRQTEQLITDIETDFFSAICAKSPQFTQSKFRRLTSASQAVDLKLINAMVSYSEFITETESGGKFRIADLYAAQTLVQRRSFRLFNFKRLKRIALFVAEGNIVETSASRPGTINWPDYEPLSQILRDENFSGVLLRINSPGGSAMVSQLLWREWMLATGRAKTQTTKDHDGRGLAAGTRPSAQTTKDHDGQGLAAGTYQPVAIADGRPSAQTTTQTADSDKADEKKAIPVYVSQGNVAASGGYYLSAAADRIFSTPVSITGSIGVVGGKFNVAPLLNKWGVSIDRAPKKHPSPLFSLFSDFGAEQKKVIKESMSEIYEQFLRDVAIGRGSNADEIRRHASGRVYSGKAAQKIGLTDAEGGLSAALSALRTALGVADGDAIRVDILPAVRESLFSRGMLPLGLSRLTQLADFSRPGIYTLDARFIF